MRWSSKFNYHVVRSFSNSQMMELDRSVLCCRSGLQIIGKTLLSRNTHSNTRIMITKYKEIILHVAYFKKHIFLFFLSFLKNNVGFTQKYCQNVFLWHIFCLVSYLLCYTPRWSGKWIIKLTSLVSLKEINMVIIPFIILNTDFFRITTSFEIPHKWNCTK